MNNKEMNGSMLCSMATNYVAAFNDGIVPNIENAWTYICKNECIAALEKGIKDYDD